MVFWKIYPFWNIIQSKINKNIFKSLIFERKVIYSPTGFEAIIVTINQNQKYVSEIRKFLKETFGTPPKTPVLDIPEDKLLGKNDHILFVREIDKQIIGCIRYHYIGNFIGNNQDIYIVDCFAINKKWRKKGVGDYLLTKLHIYANNVNIPYCMFLKEGNILPIVHIPFFSGIYVFRKLTDNTSNFVKELAANEAYKLIDIFREFDKNIFVIRNIETSNQFWRLYKKEGYKILVCFQDTYQRFEEEGRIKKMCWATAWIESTNITDNVREEASKELSATMYPVFDYVWMTKESVGNNSIWKNDGQFHWYLYQWTTCLNIKKSYCILN